MKTSACAMALFAVSVLLAPARPAHAARRAKVDIDGVEFRKGPGDQFELLGHLKKGTPVHASNYPTQGYFKVRTPKGQIGWVPATSLILGSPPPKDGKQTSQQQDPGSFSDDPPPPPSNP